MEEDNLQETSNPIEIYNNVDIEPPVVKEEVLADTIPKVEVPEKAELRELPSESEITGGLELTYKAPKPEQPKKTIEIKYDAEGKPIIYGASETERIFSRLYKAAKGEKQEPKSDYNYIEQASAGLIHASIAVPRQGFSLAAEIGDFVRGNGIPVEDRYITKLEDAINGTFLGRIEQESKDIAYSGAVGRLTDGIAQLYGAGKIGSAIVSKPLNALRIEQIAKNYVEAAKANKLVKPNTALGKAIEKASNLNNMTTKDKFITIAVGAGGFGAGAALVADSEDIGTLLGDTFKDVSGVSSPFEIDRFKKEESQDEAARKIYNRIKFGADNAIVGIPFAYGVGLVQQIAKYGKDMAYSNSLLDRWIDKYFVSPFRARGKLSQELFEATKQVEGAETAAKVTAKDLLRNIDQALGKVAKESGISTGNPAFKRIIGRLDELLLAGEDTVRAGKIEFYGFPTKAMNEFETFAKSVGINSKQVDRVVTELIAARNEFNVLKNNVLNSDNVQVGSVEFNKLMSDRMKTMFNSEYKIMSDRSIIPWLNYKPSDSDIQATKNVLARYAKGNGKTLDADQLDNIMNDIISNVKYNEVTKTPEFIIGEQSALSDKGTQLINIAKNIKGGKFTPTELIKTPEDLRAFQRLFGQKRDIRNSIVNIMEDLATLDARNKFYDNVLKLSDEAIKNGERGIVYPTYNDAVINLTNRPIIKNKQGLQIKSPLGEEVYTNPLNGKFTSQEFADALNFSDKLFWDPVFKSALYQHLVLVPKGVFQISKTILGPFSHTRNFVSNSVFTAARGNFFLNPVEIASDFKKSFNLVQPQLLYRNTPKDQQLYKFLAEQNIMGTSATAKDLQGLLDDMSKGGDFYTRLVSKFNDGLKRKLPVVGETVEAVAKGAKRSYQIATDLYLAEDELWKAYNFFAENYKYKQAYANALKKGIIKKMPDDLTIMKEAAKIVRDTLPNYSFVPDFIKGLRRLPVGNFISWPAQIISTSANSIELGIKEAMNPVTREIGLKGLASFAGVTAIAIPTINAIGRGLYGVTQDQVAALREFLPLFSKENAIFVYRDQNGDLKFIDASGTFVYNTVTGPAQSVINGIEKERVFNPNSPLMVGLFKGLVTGTKNLFAPFMEPSAYVTMMFDLWARGGKTADGRQIWNPDASMGEKFSKGLEYVAKQYAPFSIPQFQRLEKAISGTPGERGEKYNVSDEIGGFYGLRGIPMPPSEVLKKMDFKINEFKSGIRNTRGLFSGEVLKGGEISHDDIIKRYIEANAQRYSVMNKMKQVNDLAEILEVSPQDLRKKFIDRGETNAYNHIATGRFYPFEITDPIAKKFREQRSELESEFDNLKFEAPYSSGTIQTLNQLKSLMKQIPLGSNFYDYVKPEDWLIDTKRSEALGGEQQVARAPLPPTPMPDQQVVQTTPQVNQSVLPNGLTRSETALLRPEEQLIKLNQRQAGQQTGQA
jgi:hypothetical protein